MAPGLGLKRSDGGETGERAKGGEASRGIAGRGSSKCQAGDKRWPSAAAWLEQRQEVRQGEEGPGLAGCRARLYHEGSGDTRGGKAGKARRGNRVTTLACEGGLGGITSQLSNKA